MYIQTTITNKDYLTGICVDTLIEHLNLDDDLVDTSFVEGLIASAVDWVDGRINGFVTPTTVEFKGFKWYGSKITLEHKDFDSITTFTVDDVAYTDYFIVKGYTKTDIILNESIDAESTVIITYSCGSNPVLNHKQATYIVAADMYDTDRSNYSISNIKDNQTVMRLLNLI